MKTTAARLSSSGTPPPLFPALLGAMHLYATDEEIEAAAFEGPVKKCVPLLRKELEGDRSWFDWIQSGPQAERKETTALQTARFLVRLFNPHA